ncbi:MAG: von Willebrand factor type A domain-containing protein [Ignavibacteriales bacterium]|nr:von Willebrand factor type A domain-containing protein [Ignavibacteriales bacterium]
MLFFTKFFAILLLSVPLFANGTLKGKVTDKASNEALIGANIIVLNHSWGAATDIDGFYEIKNIPAGTYTIKVTYVGYAPFEKKDVTIKNFQVVELDFELETDFTLSEIVVVDQKYFEQKATNTVKVVDSEMINKLPVKGTNNIMSLQSGVVVNDRSINIRGGRVDEVGYYIEEVQVQAGVYESRYSKINPINTSNEEYAEVDENVFNNSFKTPLSTFAIDVDAASYTNVRRFINSGQLPPKDAVRVEEFINYFDYDYPAPKDEPVKIYTELSNCPWNKENYLVHIGIKGKEISRDQSGPSNLVFLIDVSGSMQPENKLPLLKRAFKLLTKQLRNDDKVTIVVYASSTGLVLEPTFGYDREKILNAIDNLYAGGSTAGGAGIQLAYKMAEVNFMSDGNNRVILATDGDFNVGISNTTELVKFIQDKKQKGIFLTVLGFGGENLKDSRLEKLADDGDGQYAYIDNFMEAKKVFVNELGATLFTIAKDSKIQVEFNPAKVKQYRLVGYENRLMNDEDFDNDKKDGGEIGAGHTVTALYEIELQDDIDEISELQLKYQVVELKESARTTDELLTVKFRYKEPNGETSKLISQAVPLSALRKYPSKNFNFSAAVAMFGMILSDSENKGNSNLDYVRELAESNLGEDNFGYREEFVDLVQKTKRLDHLAGR